MDVLSKPDVGETIKIWLEVHIKLKITKYWTKIMVVVEGVGVMFSTINISIYHSDNLSLLFRASLVSCCGSVT